MKKLALPFLILTPILCFCQLKNYESEIIPYEQILVRTNTDSIFVLDSIVKKYYPNGNRVSASHFDYYPNGNKKIHSIYTYNNGIASMKKKYVYNYDDDNRCNSLIKYEVNSSSTSIPKNKTTTTWFDDEYFNERINYIYDVNEWSPVDKIISPDHGQEDFFTTYNLNWNITNSSWDSVTKSVSYLNEYNYIDTIFDYQFNQNDWINIGKIINQYNSNFNLSHKDVYITNNNGNSYLLDCFTEYDYNTNNQITYRHKIWDLEYGWFNSDTWVWYDDGKLNKYYYSNYTPLYPEPQGGIKYKYYYNNQGLIHHRNLFTFETQTHYANEFYYYSNFIVGVEENTIPAINCYPNPFYTSTTIEYYLSYPTKVEIKIYNQIGKQVEHIKETQSLGKQKVKWITDNLQSGIYYIIITYNNNTASQNIVVIKK